MQKVKFKIESMYVMRICTFLSTNIYHLTFMILLYKSIYISPLSVLKNSCMLLLCANLCIHVEIRTSLFLSLSVLNAFHQISIFNLSKSQKINFTTLYYKITGVSNYKLYDLTTLMMGIHQQMTADRWSNPLVTSRLTDHGSICGHLCSHGQQ